MWTFWRENSNASNKENETFLDNFQTLYYCSTRKRPTYEIANRRRHSVDILLKKSHI